jgi:hypothetical protein
VQSACRQGRVVTAVPIPVLNKRYILNERHTFYQQTKNEFRSEKLYIFISGGCQVDKTVVDWWEKPLLSIREKVGSRLDLFCFKPSLVRYGGGERGPCFLGDYKYKGTVLK